MRHVWLALLLAPWNIAVCAADVDIYVTDYTGKQIVGEERPLAGRKSTTALLFASRGEYEPFSFALQPKERLTDVMIRATALRSPSGTIPADHVTVRSAEGGHGENRMLLELGRSWDMPAWSKELFWVTIHVPEQTPAGLYRGRVIVSSGKNDVASLEVHLDVLPIRLSEPPFCIGFHYQWPGNLEVLRATLRDMRQHGMTNVGPLYGFHIPIDDDDTSQLGTFIREYLAAGYTKPIMFAAPMNLTVSALTGYGPVDSKRFQQKYIEVMRKLDAETQKHDIPVIFSIGDEFTNKGIRGVQYAEKLARFVFEELPEICVSSDMNGYREVMAMAPYLNYAGFNNGWDGIDHHNRGRRLVNEQFIKQLVQQTGAIPYFVNTGKGRFPFGFFFWRMSEYGVAGKVEWFYNLGGSGGGRGSVVKLEGTKIIPTVDYERSREGVDDLKYLCRLEELLETARRDGRARSEAAAAQELLDRIKASIIPNWTAYTSGGMKWPPERLDWLDRAKVERFGPYNAIRRTVADQILALREALETETGERASGGSERR
ncbi:MAG: hypothetical protein GXP27_09730 [Planctomycetes bacterium]|nr:hypothetical protein [Planctomycetota bacterium]